MDKKKFFATGECIVKEKSVLSGVVKNTTYGFDRVVMGTDADDVIAQVSSKMKEKHGKDTRFYSVLDFGMLQIDVYELVSDRYNWDVHRRFRMED